MTDLICIVDSLERVLKPITREDKLASGGAGIARKPKDGLEGAMFIVLDSRAVTVEEQEIRDELKSRI